MAMAVGMAAVLEPTQPVFVVGDSVFSPAHGLGEVVAIERREVDGGVRDVYVIVIMVQGTAIRMVVPVQGARTVGLRRPINRKTAASLLDVFKEPRSAVEGIPWVRQHRHYQQLLHSGSAEEVARVMRDLLRLRLRKDLSFGQRQLLDSARRMLVKEVALAFGDTEASVERRFEKALRTSTAQVP
jgi:CarD family transcriptional regulator